MNEKREEVNLHAFGVPEVQRRTQELVALVEQLAGLPEIIRSINAGFDLPQVLQRIADSTVRIVHRGASATINLWRENEEKLLPLAAAGPKRRFLLDHPPRPDGIGMRVFRSGQPIVARQPDAVEAIISQAAREAGVRGLACLPVRVEDRVLGTLYVDYRRELPEYFTDNELAMLAIFADQAAVAIEKARLLEEARQKAYQLESLTEVVRTINAADELSEVLQRIADSTVQIIRPGASATINLWQESERKLLPLAAAGPQRRFLVTHPPRPDGIGMWVFRSGQAWVVRGEEVRDHVSQAAMEVGVRAFACLPVKFGHEVLGTLYVDYRQDLPGYFSVDEVETLSRLADHAAVAIRNAQLFDALEESLTRVDSLHQVGQALVRLRPRVGLEALQSIVDRAREVLKIDQVTLYQFDQARQEFLMEDSGPTISGTLLQPQEHAMRRHVHRDDTPWKVVEKGEPLFFRDAERSPFLVGDLPERPRFVVREKIKSSAALPLRVGVEIVGVMFVNYRTRHDFYEEERKMLETFANYAAIAIQNARLFERAEQRRRMQGWQDLREIDTAISTGQDLKEILHLILKKALELTDAQVGCVLLLAEKDGRFELGASHGLPDREIEECERRGGCYVANQMAETREPLLVAVRDLPTELRQVTGEAGTELAVPLLRDGQVVGVISVRSVEEAAFGEEEQRFLETFAGQAVIAIQSAERYEALERLNQDLAVSTAIAWQGLSGSTWRHDVYGRILAILTDVATLRIRVADPKSIEILDRIEQQTRLITETAPTMPTKFTREPVNVNIALHAAYEKFRKLHPEVEFHRRLAREMPVIGANNAHLTSAFEILLDNAVRAVAESAEKQVTVTSRVTDQTIHVRISDTGPGIPEKVLPYLFRQLVPDAQRTGMGALLARVAFQMYGGEISVEDTGPDGTKILVTLPVLADQAKIGADEEDTAQNPVN